MLGWQADATLLTATGATLTTVGGCCGLAGNFGVEKGHYEVSVKVAEHDLQQQSLRVRTLSYWPTASPLLAQLAGRRSYHLAELLAHHRLVASMVAMATTDADKSAFSG